MNGVKNGENVLWLFVFDGMRKNMETISFEIQYKNVYTLCINKYKDLKIKNGKISLSNRRRAVLN